MAFNNWPYTNFQDLNLGWILAKIKEALASSAAAVAKSEAVEAEVGTYSQRISDAEAEADSARNIANTARGEALNAQSDATSAIAIGQAAQGTANSALSAANSAQDSADEAIDSASTAERNAAVALQSANIAETNSQNALNDYAKITITVFPAGGGYPEDTAESHDDVEDILSAELANKKIRFILEDARTGNSYYTYDYIIKPIANTIRDMDILVFFDKSINSSQLDYYVVIFKRRAGTGDANDYSVEGADVSFSGGSGSVSGAVLYDSVQNLTTAQKAQARDNIGADSRPLILNVTESNGTFSVDKTAAEIRANLHNLALTFGLNDGVYIDSYRIWGSPPYHSCVFTVVDPETSSVFYTEFTVSVYWEGYAPSENDDVPMVTRRLITHNIGGGSLPATTNANAGDFLRLDANKNVVWATVPSAESNSFGGV